MAIRRIGTIALVVSALLFALFFANVLVGAMRWGEVLGNVAQLILLLLSSIGFVIGVLAREAEQRKRQVG